MSAALEAGWDEWALGHGDQVPLPAPKQPLVFSKIGCSRIRRSRRTSRCATRVTATMARAAAFTWANSADQCDPPETSGTSASGTNLPNRRMSGFRGKTDLMSLRKRVARSMLLDVRFLCKAEGVVGLASWRGPLPVKTTRFKRAEVASTLLPKAADFVAAQPFMGSRPSSMIRSS